MMYIAWQHNPQGKFYDEFGIHWLSWLAVGFEWFLAVAGVPCLVTAVFIFLSYLPPMMCIEPKPLRPPASLISQLHVPVGEIEEVHGPVAM